MIKFLFFLFFLSPFLHGKEQVILIHGFMRTSWSMSFLGSWLKKQGYEVYNWGYPSRSQYIEAHAAQLANFLKKIDQNKPMYFVTHSMGALVLEAALENPTLSLSCKRGKAILLAPPHQGSICARKLKKFSFIRCVLGQKAGTQLLTLQPNEWEQKHPMIEELEILIISGKKDRKVTIQESCLNSPHFHDIIDSGHTFIMNRKEVKRAISIFFQS